MISPERFRQMQTSAIVSTTREGPLVTASATPHTKGSWTSAIAVLNFHAFLCGVTLSETQTSATDTSMLVDIGADPAGGTTYTVEIPNILAAGSGTVLAGTRGISWFPCSIPKGSQIAARCQALIASDTVRVGLVMIGGKNRSNPFPHRGAMQDYGTDLATSGGTVMADAAVDTKGAWTQLGADTTRRHSGLVAVAGVADATVTASGRFMLDIGMDPAGGTTYSVVVPDIIVAVLAAETIFMSDPLSALLGIDIPAGASLAARAASNNANGGQDLEVAVYAF